MAPLDTTEYGGHFCTQSVILLHGFHLKNKMHHHCLESLGSWILIHYISVYTRKAKFNSMIYVKQHHCKMANKMKIEKGKKL